MDVCKSHRIGMLAVVAIAFLIVSGCEQDDDKSASVNVTGTWLAIDHSTGGAFELRLAQSGSDVAGTLNSDPVSGRIEGRKLKATVQQGADTVIVSGTISADALTMSGTFTSSNGVSSQWSAQRI